MARTIANVLGYSPNAVFPLAGWLVGACLLITQSASADEAALERLKAEAPVGWERLKEAYTNVVASGTGGFNVEIAVAGELKKVTLTAERSATDERGAYTIDFVYCVGPSQSFELFRDRSKGRSFTIRRLNPDAPKPGAIPDSQGFGFQQYAGRFLFAPFKPAFFFPDALVDDSGSYRIESCQRKGQGRDEVVVVRYRNPKSGETGVIELLPNRSWAFKRHESELFVLTIPTPGTTRKIPFAQSMEVEYAEEDQLGVPVPRRVRYVESTNEEEEEEVTFEFASVELGRTTPERAFSLAAYGLGRETKPPSDPSRSYTPYWLFGLAALAILAAVVIRARGR